jgi:hypothetical protein
MGITSGVRRDLPGPVQSFVPARPRMAFGTPAEEPEARRVVKSAAIALFSEPNDLVGVRLAQLQQGDELEVLHEGDVWANVITPTGLAGWVPVGHLAAGGGASLSSGSAPVAGQGAPVDLAALFAESARRRQASAGAAEDPGEAQ